MPKNNSSYKKEDSKNLAIETPVTEPMKEIISYDKILNDIQEYEAKLARLYILKAEAEKLKLTR